MKYTIVVDTESSHASLENMLKLWAEQRGVKVDSVQYGDQTNDEFFATIRWSEDDIHALLEKEDIPPTQENIDVVTGYHSTLEERSTEEGWEILETIISNCKYANEFDMQDELEKENNE